LLQCFQQSFFVFFFLCFQILSLSILFFNIELIENLALKIFFFKILWIAAVFSHMIVFMNFSKIISVDFFLILSWLKIIITIKLNHMGKALLFSSQNTIDCYSISLNVFLWFFLNCLCRLYWGKHCSFPDKTLSIATTFSLWVFFLPKLSLLIFFNIKLVENCPNKTLILFGL